LVVCGYPYRALNRFDVYVFERPRLAGSEWGYDLRCLLIVHYSDYMRVDVKPDGDGIAIWHGGKALCRLSQFDFTPVQSGSRSRNTGSQAAPGW
jgi:hypothetical protein